jgi:hypothetical protein
VTHTSNWRSCESGFTLEDLRPWLGIFGVADAGGLLRSNFVFGNLLKETDETDEMTMSREIYSKHCFFASWPHRRFGEGQTQTHAGDRETKSACWEGSCVQMICRLSAHRINHRTLASDRTRQKQGQ